MQGIDLVNTLLQLLAVPLPTVKVKVGDMHDAQAVEGCRQAVETQLHLFHLMAKATIDITEDGRQHPYYNEHHRSHPKRTVMNPEMCHHPCQFRQQKDDV